MTMSLPRGNEVVARDSKSSCEREVTLNPGNDCPGYFDVLVHVNRPLVIQKSKSLR